MKIFTWVFASILASCSMTGPALSGTPVTKEAVADIITPGVARDGLRTDRFGRTAAGDTVFCPETMKFKYGDRMCLDTNGRSAWVWPYMMVPVGRTYVGFRIVSQGTSTYYEIYWK